MALGPHVRGVTEHELRAPGVPNSATQCSGGRHRVRYPIVTARVRDRNDGRDGLVPGVRGASAVAQQAAHWVRDLPAGDRAVTLVWVKRIWRCTHPECAQQTWTESHPQIRPRAAWTERAGKQACRRVDRDGHSVAAVARDFGVGWAAVMAAVIEYGWALIEHPDRIEGVAAVGVDETAFARANPIHGVRHRNCRPAPR